MSRRLWCSVLDSGKRRRQTQCLHPQHLQAHSSYAGDLGQNNPEFDGLFILFWAFFITSLIFINKRK